MSRAEYAALGAPELLADADRPGGFLLLVDRVRQSYVDVEDPTYLDFEYMRVFADVLAALPAGRLAVTHVGGGACTFARYVQAVRPGSPQIVLEPDTALTTFVRARLPMPRGARVRVRPIAGRAGVTGLADASADVVVLDAFHGGRVPAELTTVEFFADVARVLRPDGVLLANIADAPPLRYTRRVVAAIRTALPDALTIADPGVFHGRRFGNIEIAASRAPLPSAEIRRACAGAAFRLSVRAGFNAGAPPLTDADPQRSPAPPDHSWRVADEEDF